MRTVLIGANGQLGTDLRAVLPPGTVALDWPEFDVQREEQVRAILEEYRPESVINCAAQTSVDYCEDEPAAAFAVNAVGDLHVARAAEKSGAAAVYISTDYVFGAAGARAVAYTEDDAPGPINVYGTSKLAGEYLTLASNSRALVVRTCGLYGRAGASGKGGNFIETMLRLARESRPIRVVDDQRLSPTSTVECAVKTKALVQNGARGVYHVAATDSCTWFEFAQAIFEFERLNVDLRPIGSAEYGLRARRPAMSALSSQRLTQAGVTSCRPWRGMLQEYLATRSERGVRHTAPAAPETREV